MSESMIFFEQQKINPSEKCNNLAKQYDQALLWENDTVSAFSPGKVQDDEVLARNIFSPTHINNTTGDLDPFAFDDILNKGLSTIRLSHCGHNVVIQHGNDKIVHDHSNGYIDRQYIGFTVVDTSVLRSYLDSDLQKQILAVYDTAEPTFQLHADACRIYTLNKPQKTRLRHYLRTQFSGIIPKED